MAEYKQMNVLVTCDSGYIPHAAVMLSSLILRNPGIFFSIYILHSSLTDSDIQIIRSRIDSSAAEIFVLPVDGTLFADAPVTDRYPREMYYRIFAARYLPDDIDRVLYLDPDIIVINSVAGLYGIEFGPCLFAACSHVRAALQFINGVRLQMGRGNNYINSGVMMMNLTALRREQDEQVVFRYLASHKTLFLPDQDIISALYGDRIVMVDPLIYNLSEKFYTATRLYPRADIGLDVDWVRANTSIIHYCGRNKPWKTSYRGGLNVFYDEFVGEHGGADV